MPNPPMINSQSPDTNPNGYRSPGERNMKYEDIYLRASDGINLHAWLIKTDTEDAPTIVFFHANAGNMGLRMDNLI